MRDREAKPRGRSHPDVTRQVFTLLFLRHDHEPGNVDRRFEFVAESCDEVVAGIETVTAEGDFAMAQLLDPCCRATWCR